MHNLVTPQEFYTVSQNFPEVLNLITSGSGCLDIVSDTGYLTFPISLPYFPTHLFALESLSQDLLLGAPKWRLPETDWPHSASKFSNVVILSFTTSLHTHSCSLPKIRKKKKKVGMRKAIQKKNKCGNSISTLETKNITGTFSQMKKL